MADFGADLIGGTFDTTAAVSFSDLSAPGFNEPQSTTFFVNDAGSPASSAVSPVPVTIAGVGAFDLGMFNGSGDVSASGSNQRLPTSDSNGASATSTAPSLTFDQAANNAINDAMGWTDQPLYEQMNVGRVASTAELNAAIANGLDPTTLSTADQARVAQDALQSGVSGEDYLKGFGYSDATIKDLSSMKVGEPTDGELGRSGLAAKDYFENVNVAGGGWGDAKLADTKSLINPGDYYGRNTDGTIAYETATIDPNSVASNDLVGSFSTPGNSLLAREDGSWYYDLGRSDDKAVAAAENVIKRSAFGRAPENAALVRNALGNEVKVVAEMGQGAFGQLVKKPDIDYPRSMPNTTGDSKIIVSSAVLKNPKLAAGVILHESVHQAELTANPRASKEQLTTIQSEVRAYAAEMKLWKELRGEFVDSSGNPKQGLTKDEQELVRSNEKIYRAQQLGGNAGIQKEIQTYPVYQDTINLDFERKHKPTPGPSDRSLVPWGG